MQGLSFIHAGFLVAGLAIAVPILIHLLFRQKARTLSIGSVRFLRSVVKQHHRRRRIRQWILLSLRALAMLLLALLFARPYFDLSFRRGLQQELVLLIDRSASMATRDSGGTTAFERAVKAARDELSGVDENVVVHVALCDAASVREVPLAELDAPMQTTDAATDYAAAISWAHDLLAASSRQDRRVVLFSDLQRTGVRHLASDPLPDGTQFEVRDVGQAISQNIALQSVEAIRTEIRPKEPVTLRIVIRNFRPTVAKKIPLHVRLDGPGGKVVADRSVDLQGGGTATIELPLDLESDGLYRGQVELEIQDDAAWDNRRWVAFEARHPDRLLLVDGEEGRTIYANETYYLETALRLRNVESAAQQRSFEVERMVWETGKGFPNLAGFRVIVLANVRRLTTEDVGRLNQYVRSGGSLLVFAGDHVDAAGLGALHDLGVFPGTLPDEPLTTRLRVSSWATDHVALAPFADPQRGDLRRIELTKSLPLATVAANAMPLWWSGERVLAAERPADAGRCMYIGLTADREWTNWPQSRLYVPVIRQLTAYLSNQLKDRAMVVARTVSKSDEKAGMSQEGERFVVRNIDPEESVPDRITAEELHQSLAILPAELTPEEQARRASIPLPEDAQRPNERWTTILWLLFAVLVAETLLATRVHA